jgi:hypothetical protein
MKRTAFFSMSFHCKELCAEGTISGSKQYDKFFFDLPIKVSFSSCLPEGLQQAGIIIHSLLIL